ncbi:phasin-family protein [Pseudoxanthomonas broegbernensis]|uniref:Phasin-family protein n=1 Tax=Pseudoxanthomonas broegbernensis TaxID=83619 RepID=A0A7V8K734_9GAMM|nr:phasin family protein [Pseudoxanthomonas broegbernensis]KAF1686643.1 phasin-family protein [Pseudoxanthomonas broegbernensis]MBB6063601.1 ATP phosphoribosyltransferase regulatory subunit HisZ [Pseudoxanthomonas broegbernensis]
MSYQFNDQFSAYTHQFAAAAARVNRLALESAETVFGVQLRTFEKNVDAATSYLGELAEARDLEAYKTLWPKALQVARDNAERVAAAGQEVFGLTLKTTEALGQLAKNQFEAATDQAEATVAKVAKAAKR